MAQGFDDAQAFWDARFSAPEYIFGTEVNVFLRSQAERFKPSQRVLDIACGEGRNSVWLAQQGCRVLGIDISPLALKKAALTHFSLGTEVGKKIDPRFAFALISGIASLHCSYACLVAYVIIALAPRRTPA